MAYELRRIPGQATIADAHAVRRAVFIDEQGVSEAEEMDGRDAETTHVVAYAVEGTGNDESASVGDGERGEPVGTARLRLPEPGVGKPERVAVTKPHRGNGVGWQLMEAIETDAREQGCERLKLHAQTTVEEFYRKLGYETTSGEFIEADIPHVRMEKPL